MHILHTIYIFETFARGGGGGSSSGGGGGGGEGIAAIGYLVGYYLTKLLKKYVKQSVNLVSAGCMVAITMLLASFMLAGSSILGGYILFLIVLGLWMGWYAQIHDVWAKLSKKIKKTNADLEKAKAADVAWDEQTLHAMVSDVFMRYQYDWTRLDSTNMQTYCTPGFAEKSRLLVQTLRDLNRQNAVMNPRIIKIDTLEITDSDDNTKDSFTVIIEAQADDSLIDLNTSQTIYTDKSSFVEFWSFLRNGNGWLLSGIEQSTADKRQANNAVKSFAEQNNMYYSLDMGWLFLPQNGQVFHYRAFGKSDINNHVIGMYDKLLVQVYTYNSNYNKDSRNFVIGQINVPKTYGNILVRPKKKLTQIFSGYDVNPVSGSQQYTLEWQDFNNMYEFFATDGDRLATFELLNPKFMQMMYDLDDSIVLEVVDNIVYFRARQDTSLQAYDALMSLLKQAYKELKL